MSGNVVKMDRVSAKDAVRMIENSKEVTVGEVVAAIERAPFGRLIASHVKRDLLGVAQQEAYAAGVRVACDKVFPASADKNPCRWPDCACTVQAMSRIRAEMTLTADDAAFGNVDFPKGALNI